MPNPTISQIKVGSITYDIADAGVRTCFIYKHSLTSSVNTAYRSWSSNNETFYAKSGVVPQSFLPSSGILWVQAISHYGSEDSTEAKTEVWFDARPTNEQYASNASPFDQNNVWPYHRNGIVQHNSYYQELEVCAFFAPLSYPTIASLDHFYIHFGMQNNRSKNHLGYCGCTVVHFPNINYSCTSSEAS